MPSAYGYDLIIDPSNQPSGEHGILERGFTRSALLEAGSSTTYTSVKALTPVGRITASSKIRPCPLQLVDGAQSAVTTLQLGSVETIFDGDVVDILAPAEGVAGTDTLEDLDGTAGESIDIASRTNDGVAHVVEIVDPGGNDEPLSVSVSVAEATGVATVTVSAATGGAGAVTSTLQDVVDAINGDADARVYIDASLTSGATGTTVIDGAELTATGTLAGGYAGGATIASSRTVSNRNTGTPSIDVSGAAVTVPDGAIVQGTDGSEVCIGLLCEAVTTLEQADASTGSLVYQDAAATVLYRGVVDENEINGLNASIRAALEPEITLIDTTSE